MDLTAQLSSLEPSLVKLINRKPAKATRQVADHRTCRQLKFQHRLHDQEIEHLVAAYEAGQTVDQLASTFNVGRETVMHHLKRRQIATRRSVRKLADAQVVEAAQCYRSGESLATVAKRLHVTASTVRRELLAAGHTLRPRRGC